MFDPMMTWVTYKTQIKFALAILAYLMVLVGSVTVVKANPDAFWRFDGGAAGAAGGGGDLVDGPGPGAAG